MTEMTDAQLQGGHGGQGSKEKMFSRLLAKGQFTPLQLASDPDVVFGIVSKAMDQGLDDPSDAPDDQENPYVPAGYTYFGQMVDHDLTFDNRSTLDTIPDHPHKSSLPSDERTLFLDLDCLYGLGPEAAPFMYDEDGRLATNLERPYDLPRAGILRDSTDPMSRRAIIGDPRNDENSIVCQLQLAFIHFHNAMIDTMKLKGLTGGALFQAARREVAWTYQKVIVTDFLKRIVQKPVYDAFVEDHASHGGAAYKLYKPGAMRAALPMEFTGAAYRFGHSGVRNAYRLNAGFQRRIFDGTNSSIESLVGFGDLPSDHAIDWTLFLSEDLAPGVKGDNSSTAPESAARLQYAYKIDTTLVDPLMMLPPRIAGPGKPVFRSLAARNLKRGYNFNLPSGQDVAAAIGQTTHPPLMFGDQLLRFSEMPGMPAGDAAALEAHTPLWLYVLAEGQACLLKPGGTFPVKTEGGVTVIDKDSNAGTQLGPVGGRIVMEVFFALLDDDQSSYFHAGPSGWTSVVNPGSDTITLFDVLRFTGLM